MGLSSQKPCRPCAVSGRSPNFLRACRLTTSSGKRVASLGLGEGGAGLAVRGPVGRVRLPGVKQRAPSYPLGTGRVGLEPPRLQQLSPRARRPPASTPSVGPGAHPDRAPPAAPPALQQPPPQVAPVAVSAPPSAPGVRRPVPPPRPAGAVERRRRAGRRGPSSAVFAPVCALHGGRGGGRSDVTGPSRPGTPLRPGGHLPFPSPK